MRPYQGVGRPGELAVCQKCRSSVVVLFAFYTVMIAIGDCVGHASYIRRQDLKVGDGYTDTEFKGARVAHQQYIRSGADLADNLHNNLRCDEVVGKHQKCFYDYERCKSTQRCNRAEVDYDVRNATQETFHRKFYMGERYRAIMFDDFEDWRVGTFNFLHGRERRGNHLGFDAFSSEPLVPTNQSIELNSGRIIINTTSVTMTILDACYDIEPDVDGNEEKTCNHMTGSKSTIAHKVIQGVIHMTKKGTQIATFNFDLFYVGRNVNITLVGNRGLSLLSRSSMIIDTLFVTPPGQIGGFPGGQYGTDNNVNGPCSGSLRVYKKRVTSIAKNIDEIQTVTTQATSGETLGGQFTLAYRGNTTAKIPFDVGTSQMKLMIEEGLPLAGTVSVSRSPPDNQHGYTWTITFVTATDIVPQLTAQNYLSGFGAKVFTRTIREGNTITGAFRLSFLGSTTSPIPHDISAQEMQNTLEKELKLVNTTYVVRTDPRGVCDPGMCVNNPGEGGGYVWDIILTTEYGNVSPTSQTHPSTLQVDPHEVMLSNMEGLEGENSTIKIENIELMSLAFGGMGGSFGGTGGFGRGRNQPTNPFRCNTNIMSDIVGGSGGAAGGYHPYDVISRADTIRGGNGGGVIYLSAVNDIVIGSNGALITDGEKGNDGHRAGGGGSGGAIILHASGTVTNYGLLSVRGGNGGDGLGTNFDFYGVSSGGGGGGGRIAVTAESMTDEGNIQADGGKAGTVAINKMPGHQFEENIGPGGDGEEGTVFVRTALGVDMSVDMTQGAAGTSKSLRIKGGDITNTSAEVLKHTPRRLDGPWYRLPPGSKPTRVTYYMKVGGFTSGDINSNWGGYFALHSSLEESNSTDIGGMKKNISRAQIGSDILNQTIDGVPVIAATDTGWTDTRGSIYLPVAIGVSLLDGKFMQDSNPGGWPTQEFWSGVDKDRWYKVDIEIDWNLIEREGICPGSKCRIYSIRLNDVELVFEQKFIAESLGAVGLYNWHGAITWWDEIFLGPDNLMKFRCPRQYIDLASSSFKSSAFTDTQVGDLYGEGMVDEVGSGVIGSGVGVGGTISIDRPEQTGWGTSVLPGEEDELQPITIHKSYLQKKFDGAIWLPSKDEREREGRHKKLASGVTMRSKDGDHDTVKGGLESGAIVFVEGGQDETNTEPLAAENIYNSRTRAFTDRQRIIGSTGTWFWFGDHVSPNPLPALYGGVGACSTRDFINWRNEGILLHYINVSDPFNSTGDYMIVERPKLLYNTEKITRQQEETLKSKLDADIQQADFNVQQASEKLSIAKETVDAAKSLYDFVTIQGMGEEVIAPIRQQYEEEFAIFKINENQYLTKIQERQMAVWRYGNVSAGIDQNRHKRVEITHKRKKHHSFHGVNGSSYVMWMHADNKDNSLGLAGVAKSAHPNGPYDFIRSLYPRDSPLEAPGLLPINETHDHTVLVDLASGSAFFVKTYYKNINYWLPRPVMCPLWESIKFNDNTPDFALSYHRGLYHRGYDDPDDIYLQRWRSEDKTWNHTCCYADGTCDDRLYQSRQDVTLKAMRDDSPAGPRGTGNPNSPEEKSYDRDYRIYDVSEGDFRGDARLGNTTIRYGNCPVGTVKRIKGQGANGRELSTRFKDPTIWATNKWQANAVPAFSPWGFQVYNVKLWKEDYFQALSTNITDLIFKRFDRDMDGRLSLNWENGTRSTQSEMARLSRWIGFEVTADDIELKLDPDGDGFIPYGDFAFFIGRDADVLFDKYDADKSSFLNKTEIESLILEIGVPRHMKKRYKDGGMATIGDFWTMKALDPDDDEETFYAAFERWLSEAPLTMFDLYDRDRSGVLDAAEIAEVISDMGVPINKTDLAALDPEGTGRVTRERMATWMRNYPSRSREAREYLKINNAPAQVYSDELVGPLQVVQKRRAKYIAVNQLSFDYTEMGPLISEIEGEFFGGGANDLISAIGATSISQWGIRLDMQEAPVQSRMSLSPNELGYDSASYWNGRAWERHQESKAEYQYGADCIHIHGTKEGCPESYAHSPYLGMAQEYYDNFELVKRRADWIQKGAIQERYDCFGDRRLCNKYIVNPQIRPFETAKEGVNLWNPQRQYPGIWGTVEERMRLVSRASEQHAQSRLCVNTTIYQVYEINATLVNGINQTYGIDVDDVTAQWTLHNLTRNITGLYCTYGQVCTNSSVLKNVTMGNVTRLVNETRTDCVDIVDEKVCFGELVNVTTVENISSTPGGAWALTNVTTQRCLPTKEHVAYGESASHKNGINIK